ncbi:unnamed protein product [Angiostrongylus costaricensis]|uniref:Superoxide dismutase [Cu-Zn] n=1 Tax=Angiostrongylus costaricensis TaxID=334426 RepID=A0A0R3PGJ1_ANGCS|nr:unnamed protein product [Angiostrongylus costaricensis]
MCKVTLKVSIAPERTLRARAVMLRTVRGGSPGEQAGIVEFVQRKNQLTVSGRVSGLTPGLHGMHVHQNGDLGNGCLAAGDHYNPSSMTHGSPTARVRHVGDLGNIVAGPDGVANINVVDTVMRLNGPQSVLGRALVIHAMRDDLGVGNSPLSGRPVLRARANMRRAVANAAPAETIGFVDFEQNGNVITINGSVSGLTPGLHGIHIHERGNLGNGCLDAGGHYNPTNNPHGAPSDRIRHVGDLGNLITPDSGNTPISIRDTVVRLDGVQSVIGRALVIHAAGDDLNRGLSPQSSVTGNAGGRVSCGIIEIV